MNYSAPKRILLIIVAGIGDFFESLGAIKTVREAFPEAGITLLVSSKVFDYARKCPFADNVVKFPVAKGRGYPEFTLSNINELFWTLSGLRHTKFDIAANLFEISTTGGAIRMRLLFRYINAKRTFGRNTDGRGWFFDVKIPDIISDKRNHSEFFYEIAESMTNGKRSEKCYPWISNSDNETVDALLKSWDIRSNDKLVILNPGSDRPSRRWPSANFAAVADMLAQKYSAKIVMTGSGSEEWLAQEIISKMTTPARSSCGILTLGQLVSLIAKAKLLVSTNSAAMHIAGLQHIPFVAVSGSADPWRDRPAGEPEKMIILWKDLKCGPCAHWECPEKDNMKCMKSITPEEVIINCEKFIS